MIKRLNCGILLHSVNIQLWYFFVFLFKKLKKILFKNECHTDWVSTVRFSPSNTNPVIVSAGWDRIVKVWNLGTCQLKTNHIGHGGYINSVTVSPDGSLCASGGKVC